MHEVSRRSFLKAAAGTALACAPDVHAEPSAPSASARIDTPKRADILRTPDLMTAQFSRKELVTLQYAAGAWTCAGVRVSAEPVQVAHQHVELPVSIHSEGGKLTHLHLRWKGPVLESSLILGDAWERSYGDLEWRGIIPERVMPWYFLTFDGTHVDGCGVKTQPAAMCFWQRDSEGTTLTLDLRNGGSAAELSARELAACTVVTYAGSAAETLAQASAAMCKRMCSNPRLPDQSIFGINDWNYAYGHNSAAGILRDADLLASLAPAGEIRPLAVIDDGWQDPARFPDMAQLASQIRSRGLRPGLWIRPLRAEASATPGWLLPDSRFGKSASHTNFAFDPTLPEACQAALTTVRQSVGWGYGFIKHDFSTYELLGRWGFAMHAELTSPDWHFHDRTRTNAEIIVDLYGAIRVAAGESTTILGCNTMSHLAAGVFESQRVADDTSGHDWERTRRYGVNGLSQRVAQHRTFYHVDPDCVAVTQQVGWRETSQWMDLVARSGTSLFVSPDPVAVTPDVKAAMRDAFALAAAGGEGSPVHPTSSTTPNEWVFSSPRSAKKIYNWIPSAGVSPYDV